MLDEKQMTDKLEYLSGQIAGLSVQVATAFARISLAADCSLDTASRLQEYSDNVITSKMLERSVKWRNGFRDAIGLVDSLIE